MRKHITVALFVALSCAVAAPAFAAAITNTIDEFQFSLIQVPDATTLGFVGMTEPGSTNLSDEISFTHGIGGVTVFAQMDSDIPDGETADSSADNANLNLLPAPTVLLGELGAENTLQAIYYTPANGQPGFVPGADTYVYRLVSDVPEPSSLALTGLGLLGVYLLRRRTRK